MSALIEAFFVCLFASLIWAPVIFLLSAHFEKNNETALSDKVWPAALTLAALPAFFAPIAALFGVSLRSAPVTAPPTPIETSDMAIAATQTPIAAPVQTIDIANVVSAAGVIYFYGFLMFLALGSIRMLWFSYRTKYAFDVDHADLIKGLEEWRRRMKLKRSPRYAFSDAVSSVCVHGFFRQVILFPENLLERISVEDAVLMGAHEMAHVKRGDTFLFALCTVVRAVFWFNPVMQRIAARANLAAEQSADALVIAHGAERRRYAHCFVKGLRFASHAPAAGRDLVPSFTPFDKKSRRDRLNAILSQTAGAPMLSVQHKIGLGLTIAAATALAFAQAALAVAPKSARDVLPVNPVDGEITMAYGARSIVLSTDRPAHEGVDIKAPRGALVRAAGDGKVTDATNKYQGVSAWGNVVVIDHGHGLITRYAHLDSFRVKKGDSVQSGQIIGAVGSTGKSTGPHLHFEVIQDGLTIDPMPVLAAKPMTAPEPLPAPLPAPQAKPQAPVTAPAQPNISVAKNDSLRLKIDEKLAAPLNELEQKLENTFDGVDLELSQLESLDIELPEFALDGLGGVKAFIESADADLHSWAWLGPKERETLARTQRESLKAAQESIQKAKADASRAVRDRKRLQREAERAERELERAMERSKRQAERERERAERELATMMRARELSESEVLALEEEALRQAQADLERRLESIKQKREELAEKTRELKAE